MASFTPAAMREHVAAFEQYLAREAFRSPGTVRRYLRSVHRFLAFLSASEGPLPAASAVRRTELRAYLTEEAASPAVWNVELAALRAFFSYLLREEVIAENPALFVDRQKVTAPDRVPLTFEEMFAVLDAVEDGAPHHLRTRNLAIFVLFFHAGIRVGELVSLDLHQLDLAARAIIDVRLKGRKRMSILMSDEATETLELYLADRPRLLRDQQNPAVFLSAEGTRLSARTVEEMVAGYAKRAGIGRRVTPHLLRHSSATAYAELTQLRVVQEILGHAAVTTTERYTHVEKRLRRAAVSDMGRAWTEALARHRRRCLSTAKKHRRAS